VWAGAGLALESLLESIGGGAGGDGEEGGSGQGECSESEGRRESSVEGVPQCEETEFEREGWVNASKSDRSGEEDGRGMCYFVPER
jgi:hypothetical protein